MLIPFKTPFLDFCCCDFALLQLSLPLNAVIIVSRKYAVHIYYYIKQLLFRCIYNDILAESDDTVPHS